MLPSVPHLELGVECGVYLRSVADGGFVAQPQLVWWWQILVLQQMILLPWICQILLQLTAWSHAI